MMKKKREAVGQRWVTREKGVEAKRILGRRVDSPLLVPSTLTSLVVHPRRTERMWTRSVRELAVT